MFKWLKDIINDPKKCFIVDAIMLVTLAIMMISRGVKYLYQTHHSHSYVVRVTSKSNSIKGTSGITKSTWYFQSNYRNSHLTKYVYYPKTNVLSVTITKDNPHTLSMANRARNTISRYSHDPDLKLQLVNAKR